MRQLRRAGAVDSDELSYLFVMTYGRSGSTLLGGLLNAIPGYLVRGENRDALHHLFEFHRTLLTESVRVPSPLSRRRTHPFYGIGDFPVERSLASIRRLALDTVLRPKAGTRVVGFKEIRWYHDDLEDYVAWLREVFPGARFLVNTRRHSDVLASKWWSEGGDKSADLAAIEARILTLADSLGSAAYHVHYDDWVADPHKLRGMYAWLGEEYDEESVVAVLAVRHSV